jgi:2-amino-4-hydroxy-6-hydroxymethyldihydropteridine diphosphokinase
MSNYRYCISLGSNLGDKVLNIKKAIQFLNLHPHTVLKQSGLYSSAAWGYDSSNDFLNACVLLESDIPPFELLKHIKMYEVSQGRKKGKDDEYTDRPIDLDILLCGNDIIYSETLKLPHPLMHKRNFVLVPLNEICAELRHPLLQKTIGELLEESEDRTEVYKMKEKNV